jgi:hypothetical protein
MAIDRLAMIKENCHARVYGLAVSDVSWLVQEVERLRLSDAMLRCDIEELRATRIADIEFLVDYCKKLVVALQNIDPANPAIESVRRVAQMTTAKLGKLRESNINGN